MSTLTTSTNHKDHRREDFPVESFRYLEAKLQLVRKRIMDLAAEIAEAKALTPTVYRVEKGHIDDALFEFLKDRTAAESQLGINPVYAKPSESVSPTDIS